MIVKPGKYAPPVGFIMKDKTSPSIPTSIAGTGPNIEPVIAIGKNAPLSFVANESEDDSQRKQHCYHGK